ncbi:alpha/beta hydrolase [Burkholderia sp. HI2761]|uniref:alpha/beta fold hydrolase n=1 Tax=Burkholderia TaxID=32008 RepID=UPI0004823BCA|nr:MULTISPECIES: alpha/beta hydrolase [Burkholderia]MPV57477.1 alpha/beta fold hydrolase [Burkholderia sp. BE24]OXJ22250.1 alpha/beta hydrolase [Burkholderia sp. HI2761]
MHVTTRGTRIYTEARGSGEPTLLFLHYYGGSSRTWNGVIHGLGGRYRTVGMDHRGWGNSDAPEQGYAIGDLANDVQDVVEALKLERYVIVGHSMSGKVAQLLASRRPPGLEGLVLVAPSPPSPMHFSSEQRAEMARVYDTRESIGWALDNVLTAKKLTPELREQVIADSLRGAPQAKRAWPLGGMVEDITADVASIDVPVLVIAGELDQVDRPETLQNELLPRIPAARMMVLPGTGHLSPLEDPVAIATAIRQFIEQPGMSLRGEA